jgi:mannose-6-phosphate isomerase-like protein (cupin superfamily)
MTDVSALLPVILDADDISGLEWSPFPGDEAVRYKLLWSSGWSVAGLMEVPAGGSLAPHRHEGAHHHLWVLSGSAVVRGHRLGAGSYVHIPTGVEHGVEDVGPAGFTMLYLYLRDDPGRGGPTS